MLLSVLFSVKNILPQVLLLVLFMCPISFYNQPPAPSHFKQADQHSRRYSRVEDSRAGDSGDGGDLARDGSVAYADGME